MKYQGQHFRGSLSRFDLHSEFAKPFYNPLCDIFEFNVPANQDPAALRKVGFERQKGPNTCLPLFDSSQMTAGRSFHYLIPEKFRHRETKGFLVGIFVIP